MENKTTLSPSSTSQTIKKALAEMALMRGASPSSEAITSYTTRLRKEQVEDVLVALRTIQDMPRQEGELAFPEIGVILSAVSGVGVARRNREKVTRYLVTFKCPDCGATESGYLVSHDYAPRICNSPYKFDSQGKRIGRSQSEGHCPTTMVRELDERNMAL